MAKSSSATTISCKPFWQTDTIALEGVCRIMTAHADKEFPAVAS